MKTKTFLKKSISIIICLSIAVSVLCLIPSVSAKEEYQGENLDVPQIRITTENGNGTTLQKEDGYVNAQIEIKDTDESVLADAVSFKVRGNTTAITWVTKKAFTFKFAKKKNVLGLGSGKKWALLANAFDPTYPDVSEKMNDSRVNYGLAIAKYTGSRGKYDTSDASAETFGFVRRIFADSHVIWQMAELGKVDQGGGGTIAKYMANRICSGYYG